jgi:putative ABC transport system permease protein
MIRQGIRRAFQLALRRRDRWELEVEEEIKLHLALRAEALVAAGAAPDEAYRQAVQKFGSLSESRARLLDAARHREQRMQRTEYVEHLRQDLSFAFRTLRRQKAWTTITVLTLALGIGATTAVFSVVSNLLIHAIPYPAADRIVVVQQQPSKGNNTGVSVSITPATAIVNAWRARSHTFEVLEPYRSMGLLLRTADDPVPVTATAILPSFPAFAGARPLIGRLFSAQEIANKARVALLSEGLWRERYGADPAIVGRTLAVGDSTLAVIGVLPATLRTPEYRRDRTDLWLPLDLRDQSLGMNVVGRLRRGARIGAATRELDAISAQVDESKSAGASFVTLIRRPSELIQFRDSLILLTGAVTLVLLVACANVAHLLMARGATRERELALRAALGAGRGRLFRQLLTESVLLTVAGAAGGVLLGWGGLKALLALRPANMTELTGAHVDLTTLGVTTAVAVVSGIVFGVLGAFQAGRRSTHDALKAGSNAASPGRSHDRLRSLLVVSEMAVSATLIVSATLLVRSVINLQHADLGFEPTHLYWTPISLPKARYETAAARAAFFAELTTRLRAVPHVQALSIASVPPGSRAFSVGTFEIEGEPANASAAGSSFTDVNTIDPHYFETMGIPLLEGGLFTDTSEAAGQVIVNAAFARSHWGPGGALGKRVRVAYKGEGSWSTIVGVAGEAQTTGPGLGSTAPILYSPLASPGRQESIMIRTDGPVDLARVVRGLIKAIDPRVPVPSVQSAEDYLSRSISRPRFTMALLTVFTMIALVLAAVGLYGVMSYSVAQRTREIGIRIALGATQQRIARSVLRRGVIFAVIGASVGLGSAYWATRLLGKLLYGVAPFDVLSFAAGAVVLTATAAVACIVPTRRALAVDPIAAIRAE